MNKMITSFTLIDDDWIISRGKKIKPFNFHLELPPITIQLPHIYIPIRREDEPTEQDRI